LEKIIILVYTTTTKNGRALASLHLSQRLLDLRLLGSPHKTPTGIIKGVVQFNGKALGLPIEQPVEVFPPIYA
jgi:hypothetical protein